MIGTPILRRVSLCQIAALVVLALATLAFRPAALAPLVAGGVLVALNFWLLVVLGHKAFSGKKRGVAYALLATKTAAMLGLMAVFVLVLRLDPVPFAVGLATLFVGLAGAVLMNSAPAPAASSLPQPKGLQG